MTKAKESCIIIKAGFPTHPPPAFRRPTHFFPKMKARSTKRISVLISLLTFFSGTEVFGQVRNFGPSAASDGSIFSSTALYIGIVAIVALICLILTLRRGRSREDADGAGDSLRLTYKNESPHVRSPAVTYRPVTPRKPLKEGFAALPIASFVRLQKANAYLQLPESTDPAMLHAVEQIKEESEEDVAVRTQALRLLAGYRTSNSIAAVAQVALYDLSSKLRSDAVMQLAAFDHESVFETIVTCCADPTREVRASAARALSKLSFDRSQAWTRIVESGDVARMRHAARAAIEGDLVTRSFDRLVHTDRKVAYDAFAVTTLLIRAGETEPINKAIASHKDEMVKLALLHVIGCLRDETTEEWLQDLAQKDDLPPNVGARVHEMLVTAQASHA